MLINLASTLLALATWPSAAAITVDSNVHIRVDSSHREVVISTGPVRIPAAALYAHHVKEEYLSIAWPVSGWVRGYRVDLVDSTGKLLPPELIHHVGMVNLARRQLAYPIAERLFASARETKPVELPESMGVPVWGNEQMVLYYALVNPGQSEIAGASVRVTILWTPAGRRGVKDVLPLYANAKEQTEESISFDVAPGVSTTSAEFTIPVSGYVRALGGHLHDYGVELRLEDAESNEVLARLGTSRTSKGLLLEVEQTSFRLKRHGLRLNANHRYRVVAVYDNPTCRTISAGAMGVLVGAFIPDDLRGVARVDSTDPAFQRDMEGLSGADHADGAHHEMSSHADHHELHECPRA
jgi:hypothetical protein